MNVRATRVFRQPASSLTMAADEPTNHPQVPPIQCRSEPARDKRPGNAGIQTAHVIVNDHRWNAARSKLARHKSFYDP